MLPPASGVVLGRFSGPYKDFLRTPRSPKGGVSGDGAPHPVCVCVCACVRVCLCVLCLCVVFVEHFPYNVRGSCLKEPSEIALKSVL